MAPDPSARRRGIDARPAGRQRDAERIERDYGFADWEAPDAGENAKASNFGGGNAGEGEGWDEVYTRQLETWLAGRAARARSASSSRSSTPTTCSATRPQYLDGGYSNDEFRDLGVRCRRPSTRTCAGKPSVHSLMRMGMTAYMGALAAAASSSITSTSTPTCTGSSTPRSDASSPRSATPTTRSRCARGR